MRLNMKKIIFNLGFAVLALALLTTRVWATDEFPSTAPDTATTALLLSMGMAGLAAIRKFMR
jgi:hypothetical protein